jgi:hypothetical protein
MRDKAPPYSRGERDKPGFSVSSSDFERFASAAGQENSVEEVIGEIGLVLVVILGIVVAINLVLVSLHLS